MKKIFTVIAPLLFSTFLLAHPEEPGSGEPGKVVWHSITMIDYKAGTLEEVKALIEKFEEAAETSGTALPELYWFKSGKYDLIVTWKLQEGQADFQGKWSPYGESWWKALVEQEGSEEAAIKLQSDYNQLIDASVTSVARKAQ